MRAEFTITVSVDRVSGKFASKDDVIDQITGWLENANEGQVSGVGADGDSEYEVTDWDVAVTA